MFADRVGAVRPAGERSIMKGLNASQVAQAIVAKCDRYGEFVFVGMDASRFDQHVSVPMLRWEHSVYKLFFFGTKVLRRLSWILDLQLFNKGFAYFADGIVKYTTEGSRMSGDMNTGLGNCLIMCALLWTYFNQLGIQYEVINNGDDCGIIFEKRNLNKFNKQHCIDWFLTMGFKMAIEDPVFVIEEIEFCQSHPVSVDGDWIMVRNVEAATTKDCMSVQKLSTINQWVEHWDSVGKCGLSMSYGVPMNQAYYSRLVELAAKYKPKSYDEKRSYNQLDLNQYGFAQMSKGMSGKVKPVSSATRVSFYLAFGVLPDMQVIMEKQYSMIDIQPGNIQSEGYEVLKTPFSC
jgi:hypothetical protein